MSMNDATPSPRGPLPRALSLALIPLYLLLSLAVAAAVVLAGGVALDRPPLLALGCAALAYAVERTSRRRHHPLLQNAAPAVYLAAVLLLPAAWAVLVAASAVVACQLTTRRVPLSVRCVATAQTVLVVAAFTVTVHLVLGDAALARRLVDVVHDPLGAWATLATGGVAPGAQWAPRSIGAANLALLLVCYYFLDAAPLVLAGEVMLACRPGYNWRGYVGAPVLSQLGALGLGGVAAMSYDRGAAILAVPALLALHRALERGWSHPLHESTTRAANRELSALRGEAMQAEQSGAHSHARLEAALVSVQALGRTQDVAEVARTLVTAASRLTPFRSCTVYLYEWRDGTFAPRGTEGQPADGGTVSRARVAAMMREKNLLGYSYHVRRGYRQERAAEGWHDGDLLLVPLLLPRGEVIGYLALDAPAGGVAPEAAALRPIETVAALAASVIARLRHTQEALVLAATDGLTELLNRRAFEERLRYELAEAARARRPLTLLMVDIDDFGNVNNTYGHPTGDAALRLVSGVVREHLRESDAGCRYGGDEFAVILPGLDAIHALDVAERLRVALVETTSRAAADGALPRINTSIGVAAFPHDAASPEDLIKAADDALYHSKRLGKNRVSLCQVA